MYMKLPALRSFSGWREVIINNYNYNILDLER